MCIVTIAAPAHGIGGINDLTRMLARGLARSGHEVEVIAPRHPQGLAEERREGIRYRHVDAPPFRHLDRTWLRRSFEAFATAHAEAPFDVVHGQGSSALELIRRGVHREVPVVTNFHGNFLDHASSGVRRLLAARRLRPALVEAKNLLVLAGRDHFRRGNWYRFRATEAIVSSQGQLAGTCRSHLLERSRTHVVPNGVDVEVFRPRPKDDLRAELGLGPELLLVCVSRLNPAKGIHHSVQALAAVGGAHLAVVGDGEDRQRLESLAHQLGVADRVVFAGAQPEAKVAAYLAASDVFLFPTGYPEAGPVSLLQAMSSGLPVVASDLGGIPEVVGRDGDCGILLPAGDVGALARAMELLASEPELRRRMGNAARQRILDGYSLERMTERMLAVYAVARERLEGPGHDVRSRAERREARLGEN